MKNKNFVRKRQAIYISPNKKSTRIIKTLMDFFFFIKVKIKMVCFSVPSIRAWQNEMIAKDYSNSYLDRMQNMITALFNYAVDYFNLAENPCHKAGRMGKREVVVNFWTKEEFDRILAAMEDDPTAHVSFSLLYYSGIRFGEFLALTPKDFDFEKNTLDITKSLQRIKKQDVVTPPKTPKSIRHSHASYLINLGCAPLLISERLGHEKVQTTLSTYSHLYPNKHQEVVDMMQKQHKLETVAAGASEASDKPEKNPQPQNTKFKVVSPKDKISPQQVYENDLSPCVGFAGRT